jgi:sugar-specific transcriptional regulator TrmB
MAHNRYTSNGYLASEGNLDTSSEGLSVNYPSNWIKSTMENGNTVYILDNKATYVSEVDANLQGKFNIDAVIKGVKSKFGISQVDTSQQTINGRTVDVLDYKFIENETKIEVQIHQVTFYNNNHVYGFTIGAIGDISSKNMDSFNDMLKTVTFAN